MKGWNQQTVTAALEKLRERNMATCSKKEQVRKYRNTKTEVNGIKFDSKKEAARYKELLLQQKLGLIGLLELQVPFELNEGGTHSLKYIADFRYIISDTGETIVEDVKGFKTAVYKKKRRLMLKVHGITIKET